MNSLFARITFGILGIFGLNSFTHAAPPQLEFGRRSDGLLLSWETVEKTTLETSSDLKVWAAVTETITEVDGIFSVKIPFTSNSRFFRLVTVPGPIFLPAFSFRYGGSPSNQLLPAWIASTEERILDASRTQQFRRYSDPATGLQVTVEELYYQDFPAVEWLLWFENKGTANSPLLDSVYAGDFRLIRGAVGEFKLVYADGSHERITDFRPRSLDLMPGTVQGFAPLGGRSSDGVLPYFNVVQPGGGSMLAIGWTGQWSFSVARDQGTGLTVKAGMEQTRIRLRPGEKIRTPRMVLLKYAGNPIVGHNLWRRFMIRHGTPAGAMPSSGRPIAASGASIGFNNVSQDNQIQAIANVVSRDLLVDTWWIDAGWSKGGFPNGMGTWDPDPVRFPNGLRPVADRAHKAGLKFLLWFEPERVMPGTWLRQNHPEWLLAPAGLPNDLAYQQDWRLLNFGNPQALAWAKEKFSGMIRDIGIDIYRHDANLHPVYYWRTGEAFDRNGINEIRYITGFYDYLDTLQAHHPGLLIDNSASGGRRLDIEMMRRSVPLLRSDYLWDPDGAQSMTYGLSFWLPLHGQGGVSTSPYDFQSGQGSWGVYAFNYYGLNDSFWSPLAQSIQAFKTVRHFYSADFHPLTPYSTARNVWMAWQFDDPASGKGLVQAFRRAESPGSTGRFKLQALKPDSLYEISQFPAGPVLKQTGNELMNSGLLVTLSTLPGAAMFIYQPIK